MKRIIGIVCEFNPFHKGHQYLLDSARSQAGDDATIICVMSGDFVQRGEPALYSKYARAEAACRCGGDLVVELPLPWSVASAEGFARASVSLLAALGCTHICFGSECGDISALQCIAKELLKPELIEAIKSELAHNSALSFAHAREAVLKEHIGEIAELISLPNNILAVEYLKAIDDLKLDMEAMTVKRVGNGHDEEGESVFKSSSELRRMIFDNKSIEAYIPEQALEVYSAEDRAGRGRINMQMLEQGILSRLRILDEYAFGNLPDSFGGAGRRLYKAVCEGESIENILELSKTKRFALARLRRMLMCATLGIRADMQAELPTYARVLAANANGCSQLRIINDANPGFVVTKTAVMRAKSGKSQKVFACGASAHDLYVLANCSVNERKPGEDWKKGPKIVQQ